MHASAFEEFQEALEAHIPDIRLAPGVYTVTSTLNIASNVSITAVGGIAQLDGEGERRVLAISAGVVQLIGLSIIRGNTPVQVCSK